MGMGTETNARHAPLARVFRKMTIRVLEALRGPRFVRADESVRAEIMRRETIGQYADEAALELVRHRAVFLWRGESERDATALARCGTRPPSNDG